MDEVKYAVISNMPPITNNSLLYSVISKKYIPETPKIKAITAEYQLNVLWVRLVLQLTHL